METATRVLIRWMLRRDMEAVLDIEQDSFGCPWDENDFIRCLQQRNCIGMVAEHEDRIVAFMVYALYPKGIALLNLAVAAAFRRQGVGQQMMAKLKGKLARGRYGRRWIQAKVNEYNDQAIHFFRAAGFLGKGMAWGEYPAWTGFGDAGAILMEYRHG